MDSIKVMENSEEMPAIWPLYEAFYIESMLFCTASALTSRDFVVNWLQGVEQSSDWSRLMSSGSEQILDELLNIVNQGAALSRYFFPARAGKGQKHEKRAARLREVFDVNASSPLKDRNLRNSIEHFDERLDDYLAKGIAGIILPKYIGYTPDVDDVPHHLFRAFYIDTAIFEVLGERFEIQPLVDEILRIHQLLDRSSKADSRLA